MIFSILTIIFFISAVVFGIFQGISEKGYSNRVWPMIMCGISIILLVICVVPGAFGRSNEAAEIESFKRDKAYLESITYKDEAINAAILTKNEWLIDKQSSVDKCPILYFYPDEIKKLEKIRGNW